MSSIPTSSLYTYQPLDASPRTDSTHSINNAPSSLATKVRDFATRGRHINVMKSVSGALDKVGQFAAKAKDKWIQDFKNHPVSYLAATIAAVGVLVATFFIPPAGVAVVAGLGVWFMAAAGADEENRQVDRKLQHEFGLVTRHPTSYIPTGRGAFAGTSTLQSKGVSVHSVKTGSSSESAGVVKSDKITAVNGQPVHNKRALLKALEKAKAEGETTLTIERGSNTHTLNI